MNLMNPVTHFLLHLLLPLRISLKVPDELVVPVQGVQHVMLELLY